jgi:2-haloacid dehalogenase
VEPLRVLLFDVFGTLVDWRSSLIDLATASAARSGLQADWAAIVDDWRRAYQPALDEVRRSMSEPEGRGAAWTEERATKERATREGGASRAPRSRAGRHSETWRDLDSVQRETLRDVLARHGVRLPAAEQESLVTGWRQLRAWPDSREGLDRLRRRHVTATLSNGHLALLADLLKFAGLRVDALLSAQLAGSYKPDPEVYLTALRLLDCPPAQAGMVAAHPSDLRAAAALGLRPIFVRRPLEWGPGVPSAEPPVLDGLIDAGGLDRLAEALGC